MELKDQVSNFELSKKLFDIGFKSKHIFSWKEFLHDDTKKLYKTIYYVGWNKRYGEIVYSEDGFFFDDEAYIINTYPAYTVAELGVLLPKEIEHNFNTWSSYYISFGNDGVNNEPGVWYMDDDLYGEKSILHGTGALTEADARAQMLIWLIENGKIKIENGDRVRKEG